MPKPASEEIKQKWKDKIQAQRESGRSIANWCKENDVTIHTFNYWRDKLSLRLPLNRVSFSEITGQDPEKTAITIEYRGFQVFVDSESDPAVLKGCLNIEAINILSS